MLLKATLLDLNFSKVLEVPEEFKNNFLAKLITNIFNKLLQITFVLEILFFISILTGIIYFNHTHFLIKDLLSLNKLDAFLYIQLLILILIVIDHYGFHGIIHMFTVSNK